MSNDLVITLEENKVSEETALSLKQEFMPFFEQAVEWKNKAKDIIVTSEDQTDLMLEAREARLAIKSIRVETEKKRKELKEESLRKGKAIDGMANIIKYLIVPIEEHLQTQEDFVKVREEKRKAERLQGRLNRLAPYNIDTSAYNVADMTDESFESIIQTQEKLRIERIEAEKKIEQDRIEREKKDAQDRENIRLENEKLKKEAGEREKKAKIEAEKRREQEEARLAKERKERAAQEAKLKKEREQRAKVEAELKAKKDAEEKAKREQAKLEKEKQLAPEKKKLEILAVNISMIELPKMESEEGKMAVARIISMINELTAYIKERSVTL